MGRTPGLVDFESDDYTPPENQEQSDTGTEDTIMGIYRDIEQEHWEKAGLLGKCEVLLRKTGILANR